MKVKRFIIVPAIIMILLAFSGCTNKATTLSNEDIPLSSQPSLSPTRKPEQEFYPQVVINDSLLDLNYDDFMEKYNTLSDDYEIEMFAAVNMYTDSKELDINEETNTITKKQAAEVTEIYGGDFEAIFVVSLKGLRYFPNIKKIYFLESGIVEIKELEFMHNLEDVCFTNCKLGVSQSTDELRYLSGMRKINLEITGGGLQDLNFLDAFPTQEKVAFSGFINPNTGQLIIKECNKFNYETIMEAIYHFQKTQNTDRKVLIIMDNAPWHKKAVRLLREENIENIEFLFLPPYSPELNPIERIWRITRRERTHNVYFDKLELLRERLLTYFMQFSTSNIKLKILCHNYNYL